MNKSQLTTLILLASIVINSVCATIAVQQMLISFNITYLLFFTANLALILHTVKRIYDDNR